MYVHYDCCWWLFWREIKNNLAMNWRWPTCCRMIKRSWRSMTTYGFEDVRTYLFCPCNTASGSWAIALGAWDPRTASSTRKTLTSEFDATSDSVCYLSGCCHGDLTSLAMGLKAKLDVKLHRNSSRTSTWIPNQSQSIKLLKLRIHQDTSDILSISGKIFNFISGPCFCIKKSWDSNSFQSS